MTGPVIIGGVNSHAGTRLAILVEGHARRHGVVREGAVAVVMVELIRLRVVGDAEVQPAVAVIIEQGDAKRFARGIVKPRPPGDVLKSAVAFVTVKSRALSFVCFRRAVGLALAVERTKAVFVNGPLDVVADKEVELPIFVVIEPRGAG